MPYRIQLCKIHANGHLGGYYSFQRAIPRALKFWSGLRGSNRMMDMKTSSTGVWLECFNYIVLHIQVVFHPKSRLSSREYTSLQVSHKTNGCWIEFHASMFPLPAIYPALVNLQMYANQPQNDRPQTAVKKILMGSPRCRRLGHLALDNISGFVFISW